MVAAKEAGAKRALPLAVSAPSHTPLMQPAADAMSARLQQITINVPVCPVWGNAAASPQQDVAKIRDALVAQLVSPVRWTETVQKLAASGICQGVEMGPGKVLSGLVKRIERDMLVGVSLTPDQIDASLTQISGE